MSETGRVVLDAGGFPVLLADVAPSGVAKIDPDAAGGNPAHDTRSGKFAPKAGEEDEQPPPNTTPLEFSRMLDAVRDAAREFDDPDVGDIQEFLQGRAKAPDQVDVQNFLLAVLEQRKNDIVDILDQNIRSSGSLPQGRRKVRISAPRGYVRKAMGGMNDSMLAEVMHRLEARGHSREAVDAYFEGKVKDETRSSATEKRNAVQASEWEIEGDYIALLTTDQET